MISLKNINIKTNMDTVPLKKREIIHIKIVEYLIMKMKSLLKTWRKLYQQ